MNYLTNKELSIKINHIMETYNVDSWSRVITSKSNKITYDSITYYTPHLLKCKVTERIYHLMNNLTNRPKCAECGINYTRFLSYNVGYRECCSVKCSRTEEVKTKFKATMKKKYGVEHNSYLDITINKRRKTRMKNGYAIKPADMDAMTRYKKQVDYYTGRQWCIHQDKINPNNLQRGRYKGDYQLDHIYSKHQGFLDRIDPKVVGHWTNLQMITKTENILKGPRCDKTKEQLFEEYQINTISN